MTNPHELRLLLQLSFLLAASSAHAITNSQALAEADAYIASQRQGPAHVQIAGLLAGSPVEIRQKKLAFDFGAGIHGAPTGGLLSEPNTTKKQKVQAAIKQNFQIITAADSMAYWVDNEPQRDQLQFGAVDELLAFAQANGIKSRLHPMFYDDTRPGWSDALSDSTLLAEMRERVDDYVVHEADQIDGYNESWNHGERGDGDTYWNRLGVTAIAEMYDRARDQTDARIIANEYGILNGGTSAEAYRQHLVKLQSTSYGPVLDGIGLEAYYSTAPTNLPSQWHDGYQKMATFGLPISITEFGTFNNVNSADSAKALGEAMRMAFGSPLIDTFVMWDWVKENSGSGQFAAGSALYTVNTSNWNTLALTAAGKVWQDQLGIADWDGNPANGWRTNVDTISSQGGLFEFTGFFGEYEITAGGQTHTLSLAKGVHDYTLGSFLPGDFNFDGTVDAADYTVWRDTGGTAQEYQDWRDHFGSIMAIAVPEPAVAVLLLAGVATMAVVRWTIG